MTAGAFGLQRRRLLIGVPASVLGAPLRAATPGVDAPPEPGAPRPIVIPPIRQERLPNGLTLLVVPRGGLPLVTASLYVRAGREVDPDDRAGLAILTGTLLTKGTRRGDRVVAGPKYSPAGRHLLLGRQQRRGLPVDGRNPGIEDHSATDSHGFSP